MAKPKSTPHQQINALITNLEAPLQEVVVYLRQLVLDTDEWIEEQIKWNSMSFYYFGEMKPFDPKEYKRDILVCNIHRGKILLVFPTGAKVFDNVGGKNYPDGRKIIPIVDLADLKVKEIQIKEIIQEWLAMVE